MIGKNGITEAKVQRMRNIVTGKYKAKTVTQVGYKKSKTSYTEGDVWEERGKSWTIKNGIRQNLTKMSGARVLTPFTCPECGNRMKKRLDKKFHRLRKKCFDCVVSDEHTMRMDGTFEAYQRSIISKKLETIYTNVETSLTEYVETVVDQTYITEAGIKEDWSGGYTKEQYTTIVEDELRLLRLKIDGYNKED